MIDLLCKDLVLEVSLFLDYHDIENLRLTSKLLLTDLSDNYFWYKFISLKTDKYNWNKDTDFRKLYRNKFMHRYKFITLVQCSLRDYEDKKKKTQLIMDRFDEIFKSRKTFRNKFCVICDKKLTAVIGNVCSYECLLANITIKNLLPTIYYPQTMGLFQYWMNQALSP